MKRTIGAVAALLLFALNWAAWHDIARGEPNLVLEWVVVALTLVAIAVWTLRRVAGRAA